MKHTISVNNRIYEYELTYKNVKNINLRIKPDCSINVSASRRVPKRVIDDFLASKSDFIESAIEKYKKKADLPQKQYFDEKEIRDVITGICREVYPHYEALGISYPQIRFRKMISRWGSCHTKKGVLTFNTNLIYAPRECIEYVVVHEFTHFLQANHSDKFYLELAKVCPEWKKRRKELKEIVLYEKM